MTQGACRILIYLGTLRHLWRSIKSLRKLSRDDADNGNDSISPNVHLDILEVWSLLGLHSLYISTGLEQFFQYFPLYFYVKMFGLFLFFFLPSASNQNVIAQFLFDRVLVQGVDQLHRFLDNDYSGWMRFQVYMIPWRIADLVFPGMLVYSKSIDIEDYERRRNKVWLIRRKQLMESKKRNPFCPSRSFTSENVPELTQEIKSTVCIDENDSKESVDSLPESKTQLHSPERTSSSQESTNISPDLPSTNSPTSSESKKSPPTSPPTESVTSSPKQNSIPTPISPKSRSPPKKSDSSIFSPIAQSRVHSSSISLQNFSRSHKNRRSFLPIVKETKKSRASALHKRQTNTNKLEKQNPDLSSTLSDSGMKSAKGENNSLPEIPETPEISDAPETPDVSTAKNVVEAQTPPPTKSPEIPLSFLALTSPTIHRISSILSPRSIGKSLRKFVTGNANIRVRDFLFDLDLPLSSAIYSRRRRDSATSQTQTKKSKNKNRRKSTGDVLHRRPMTKSKKSKRKDGSTRTPKTPNTTTRTTRTAKSTSATTAPSSTDGKGPTKRKVVTKRIKSALKTAVGKRKQPENKSSSKRRGRKNRSQGGDTDDQSSVTSAASARSLLFNPEEAKAWRSTVQKLDFDQEIVVQDTESLNSSSSVSKRSKFMKSPLGSVTSKRRSKRIATKSRLD